MKMTIKHENDEFLVITLRHVSSFYVDVNLPRTIKLLAVAPENGHKMRKQ